jgi:phosphate transport system protein
MRRRATGERVRALTAGAVALGRMARDSMAKARRALEQGDEVLARRVAEGDAAVDRAARALEGEVLAVLATASPMAADMRRVVAVFKALTDLERVGDYAVHAAAAVAGGWRAEPDLVAMAAEAEAMAGAATLALGREDARLARRVMERDGRVDRLYRRLRRRWEEAADGEGAGGRWLLAARSLERAADHAVHVAEWAVYAAVGERPAPAAGEGAARRLGL